MTVRIQSDITPSSGSKKRSITFQSENELQVVVPSLDSWVRLRDCWTFDQTRAVIVEGNIFCLDLNF